MNRPQLGTKVTCGACGIRYYDLNRPAALCPTCGEHYKPPAPLPRAKRTTGSRVHKPAPYAAIVSGPQVPAADPPDADAPLEADKEDSAPELEEDDMDDDSAASKPAMEA